MKIDWLRTFGLFAKRALRHADAARAVAVCLVAALLAAMAGAQAVSTTTVQGTEYLANGQPGSGTLVVSWPAFTTAAGQAIVADSTTVAIAPDGFVSVNLAPNVGATPAGEYYTAVFYLSDGSTSTQYWVVPAAAQATLAQVQSQVMPAAQAVQTVSKSYVDQSISELAQSLLTASAGNLSGPLYLNSDPSQPLQAADKHYVDSQVATALPLSGGTLSGPLSATQIGAAYQADQFPGADFGAKVQACLNALNATYGGTCDARNFIGSQAIGSNLTISTGNASRAASVRDDIHGEPDCCGGWHPQRGTARMRDARRDSGKRKPGRDGTCVFRQRRDGAGWRPNLCCRYTGIPLG